MKKKKKIIYLIIFLIVFLIAGILYFKINKSKEVTYKTENDKKKTTYSITLDSNGGKLDTFLYKVTVNDNYNNLPIPEKDGYTFIGWYYNDTKIEEDTKVTLSSKHTLIAKYKALKYKVTFDSNGGMVSSNNKTITYDDKYGKLPTPSKTGYNFVGWYYDNKLINEDSIVNINSDHTLIAKWNKITNNSNTKTYKNTTINNVEDKKIKTFNVSHTGYNSTYDGKEHSIKVNCNVSDAKIKYSTDNVNYTNDNPKYKDTGDYTIYYKVEKDGYETVLGSEKVIIAKKDNTISIDKTSGNLTYPENDIITVTTDSDFTATSSNETIAKTIVNDKKVTVKSNTQDGTATITIKTLDDENHIGHTLEYIATVSKGTIDITANNYTGTYDGTSHKGSVTTTLEDVTIKYGETEGTYNLQNMPEYTNAGTYVVYYEASKEGYNTKTGSITVNIAKKDNTISIDKTSGNLTYPENDIITVTTDSDFTVTSNDEAIAKTIVNDKKVTVKSNTQDGTATITIKTLDNENHIGHTLEYTAIVSKGTIDITANNYTGTYDESAHKGSVTTTLEDVTIKYGETEGTYNLTNMPEYTNAGTYVVYYEASKAGYYNQTGSIIVAIEKANNTLSLSETSGEVTYENNETFDIETNKSGGNLSVTIEDETLADVSLNAATVTITGKLKEGQTTIKVQSVETDNYNSATKTYNLTVKYPTYNVTLNLTNATASKSKISVKYAGNSTVTITPNTNYYIESVSCTNGYTTDANVGTSSVSEQSIKISNNNNIGDSTCTVTGNITLFNIIKSQAKNDTINFSVRSGTSKTNGVYKTTSTDSENTVYYYRGNVNNNVIFNNMCWKIVRTTETGGVKLIYNGTPSNGKCTATGTNTQIGTSVFNTLHNDNAYVGYMYGTAGSSTYAATHTNTNNSTIKSLIDNWYSTNFTSSSITSNIEDTVYCDDRSIVSYNSKIINDNRYTAYGTLGYGTYGTLYGAMYRSQYRTISPNPSLKCTNQNDKFTLKSGKTNYNSNLNGNKVLDYPVGLITLDEAIFAGFNTWASNSSDYKDANNYLYTGQNYWTMTPTRYYAEQSDADVGYIASEGQIEDYVVINEYGVRPVISLKDGILIKSGGTGESTNPYIIETEIIVTYNPNGGSVTQTSGIQGYNSNYADLPTPTRDGYTFIGWFTEKTGGSEITTSKTVTTSTSHTLYAHWVLTDSLYSKVVSQAKNDTVNFSVRSGTSGTNGVYKTTSTDSENTVYYYRGNVSNNVIFNNMCWKIVRTTETGGVKLIYNGTPSSGQCTATEANTQIGTSTFNSLAGDNTYAGYMYGTAGSSKYSTTHANTNNSTIKTAIDNWYSTNFTNSSITSKIEDTVYCNDRSTVEYKSTMIIDTEGFSSGFGSNGYGTSSTLYSSINRASYYAKTPNPTLVCTNNNDKFTVNTSNGNGALTYPVGLITLDEAVFAGFNTYASNTSNYVDTTNYLYTGSLYWTMSPVYFAYKSVWGDYVSVGLVNAVGNIHNNSVNNSYGVRPVISLKEGTLVTSSGTGTATNPYVVE